MKKRRFSKKRFKKALSTLLIVFLCVTMNINPLATIGGALVEIGLIDRASTIGENLLAMSSGRYYHAFAASEDPLAGAENSSCSCADYSDVLERIRRNTQGTNEDTTEIKGYDKKILDHTKTIDDTTKAILKDTDYIIKQLGYDPDAVTVKPTNVMESFERVSDQLDQLSHEYRVANIKSLNNEFTGALWKPKYDDIPNLTSFCEVTGGFANTYSGYWDLTMSDVIVPNLPADFALEELGYDAILRAEGIVPVELEIEIGKGADKSKVSIIPGGHPSNAGAGVDYAGEVVVYDQNGDIDLTYNDWGQITDSYDVSELIPTSEMMKLMQITIPANDITYLDAVTVLYKALGQEQTTLQGLYSRDPNLEVESSPLAKSLPGVVDNWEGYNYYVFATRSNPISYDLDAGEVNYNYTYWRKAVNSGVVNYKLRDEPISAIDFCTLAMKMMIAFGEPEMTDNEIYTLLQVYGSYYPIQLGENCADAWAYLKARGIITDNNFPELYTASLTREQLLDMCARIKNPDLRATYKNIQLAITLDDVAVDRGIYPYYDFNFDRNGQTYVTTTIDYTAMDTWEYLFPMTTDVNLGYGGVGGVYMDEDLSVPVGGAMYQGMIKLHESNGSQHYYYVVSLPKEYKGNAYFAFKDMDDPKRVMGTVKAVEFNPQYMTGGIWTQYVITGTSANYIGELDSEDIDGIATLADSTEGVNHWSFATMPNNMDLIWYNDNVRSDMEKPEQIEVARISGPDEYLAAFWNKLTEPMVAYAAPPSQPVVTKKWSIKRNSSNSNQHRQGWFVDQDGHELNLVGTYLKEEKGVVLSTGEVFFYQDGNTSIERAYGSAAAVAVARGATCSDFDIGAVVAKARANGGGIHDTNAINSTWCLSGMLSRYSGGTDTTLWEDCFSQLGTTGGDFQGKHFPALYYLASNGVKAQAKGGTPSAQMSERAIINSLRTTSSLDTKILNELNTIYTKSNALIVQPLGHDGCFEFSSSDTDNVNRFDQLLSQLVSSDDNLAYKGAGESGLSNFDLDKTLQTSILMGSEGQVYVAWSDMVKYGIAKSTEKDGLPDLPDMDDVFEFYTNSGVVRVDNQNKIIQIGTQIYTFSYQDAEKQSQIMLVVADDAGKELYFDIRCITGISNANGYTLDAGKATRVEKSIGAGSYVTYKLNDAGVFDDGTMKTIQTNTYTFGDLPSVNPGALANSNSITNLIQYTLYDGQESGDGTFTYWDDSSPKATRMTLNSTIPVANWIFVTSDTDGSYGGRLYVFYLAKAFEEGFVNDVGGSLQKPTVNSVHKSYWTGGAYQDALANINVKWPNFPNFEKTFNDIYDGKVMTYSNEWLDMTKCALANLVSDTGVLWTSPYYYCRMFDYTNSSASNATVETDMRVDKLEKDDSAANDPGSVYFLDFLGFVYNMPYTDDFTLEDYYAGKYPLPLAYNKSSTVVNYNLNYYGADIKGTDVPLGYDLTSYGFVHYKDKNPFNDRIYDLSYAPTDKTQKAQQPPFDRETFICAPSAVYAKYGLFNNIQYDYKLAAISSSMTDVNDFFLGSRRVVMSGTGSTDAQTRNWVIGSNNFQPIALGSKLYAELVHKYMAKPKGQRNGYVIRTEDITGVNLSTTETVTTLGLTTPDLTWEGKQGILNILNMVDKGTNWWIWICFTLAPMICVILMTILIGMSFLTDSKIWLGFCDRFFDPVRILTFGARDSHTWHWKKVLVPCLITYIAFALLCNANILKIIIFVVDGWMKLMQRL